MKVLHACDVSSCVNPAHLREGTQASNVKDALKRGRQPTKLKPEQVIEIRRLLRKRTPQREIALMFGVGRGTISRIARGLAWKHTKKA